MQYYLCPRCQFRIAANKKVCTTCGFNLAALKNAAPSEDVSETGSKAPKTAFWSKYLGQQSNKESAQEKPALG